LKNRESAANIESCDSKQKRSQILYIILCATSFNIAHAFI
jgi:hypothetical protein